MEIGSQELIELKIENTKVLVMRCTFFKLDPVGKSCKIPGMLFLSSL